MNPKLAGAISSEGQEAMEEGGAATEVADWVIRLRMPSPAHMLYVRMCCIAKDADFAGVELDLPMEAADRLSHGNGQRALDDLLEAQAITKVEGFPSRYRIEIYPPEVRALIEGRMQAGGQPLVNFG